MIDLWHRDRTLTPDHETLLNAAYSLIIDLTPRISSTEKRLENASDTDRSKLERQLNEFEDEFTAAWTEKSGVKRTMIVHGFGKLISLAVAVGSLIMIARTRRQIRVAAKSGIRNRAFIHGFFTFGS